MDRENQNEIALFRYRIIAPVLNETGISQMKYFRQMSEKELDVPHLGRKRFKPDTFKGWLRNYRNGGFEALKPKLRIDKGIPRKIDERMGKIIKEKTQKFSFLSCSGIYRLLISACSNIALNILYRTKEICIIGISVFFCSSFTCYRQVEL